MEFIAHRINTALELKSIPLEYGIELDLRADGGRLIMAHDPFVDGEEFEEFLKHYKNTGIMILNSKCERIEHKVHDLLEKYSVTNYFFLDSSFPMIKLLSEQGERKIAVRLSEFEGMDTVRSLKGRIDWVWVDCFTKFILTKDIQDEIHSLGMKICLVSPELQGRADDIDEHVKLINERKLQIDAVCTKIHNIDKWKNGIRN